jgi:hypothetical protein
MQVALIEEAAGNGGLCRRRTAAKGGLCPVEAQPDLKGMRRYSKATLEATDEMKHRKTGNTG